MILTKTGIFSPLFAAFCYKKMLANLTALDTCWRQVDKTRGGCMQFSDGGPTPGCRCGYPLWHHGGPVSTAPSVILAGNQRNNNALFSLFIVAIKLQTHLCFLLFVWGTKLGERLGSTPKRKVFASLTYISTVPLVAQTRRWWPCRQAVPWRRRGSPMYSMSIPPRLKGTSRQPRPNKSNRRGRLAAAAPGKTDCIRLLPFDLRHLLEGRNFRFFLFCQARTFFLFLKFCVALQA